MDYETNYAGQRVDYREHNDNAPPRYSAPDASFKRAVDGLADPDCGHCGGRGYIRRFKHHCGGRCFRCIPDEVWVGAQEAKALDEEMGELYESVRVDDHGGAGYLGEGMWISPNPPYLLEDAPLPWMQLAR